MAAQPAPPTQPPSPTALVAAARARLDASELQEDRGSKRDVLARTPPSATAPERPPPPADARKRPATRGGACLEAALARAAPAAEPEVQPITPPITTPPPPSPPPPTPSPPPPEAPPQAPLHTDPQRCPSQRPRLPRRPHWRSSPQVHALRCLRQAQCPPSHTTTPSSPPHPLPPPTHRPTTTAPPHRAYPTRRRHPTRASPTRRRAASPRSLTPHALPRDTRRSIHRDRPCPPSPERH